MPDVQNESIYQLPNGYDDTRIVLMTRDPHCLYAYWEISSEKRNAFIRDFGNELWDRSYPVLKVTNVSKNESFYIRINDYTNNWYIHVNDANSLYTAEIGRRVSQNFFIALADSNYAMTPTESVSKNTKAYFADYRTLKGAYLDVENNAIIRYSEKETVSNFTIGLSSPEHFGVNLHESVFGVSSAELFGINITQFLGISSESFLTRERIDVLG